MRAPALLFCPADRPERLAKAAAVADTVIIDLEDAVAPECKAYGRESLRASMLAPEDTVVRINPAGTAEYELDLLAVEATDYRTLMLAKAEHPAQIDQLHARGYSVIALCETALGVENAFLIAAHEGVTALMWGAEDLIASMGGTSSRLASGKYREVARAARSRVLVAARAAGKQAIDAVHLDIPDVEGLRVEATDAVASGFWATACIHPTQVRVIRDAYLPRPDEVAWARNVLESTIPGSGVFQHAGQMVDEPLLRQARVILERLALSDLPKVTRGAQG
ncbi:HpcH/HpaI aldolase/citrate lyase family protein [Microbacterium aurum]